MPFITFVSNHPVGSLVEATVDRFSSHGAYATVAGAQCYIPLKAMAVPAPTKAREVLTVGEVGLDLQHPVMAAQADHVAVLHFGQWATGSGFGRHVNSGGYFA